MAKKKKAARKVQDTARTLTAMAKLAPRVAPRTKTTTQRLEELLAVRDRLREAMPTIGEAKYPDGLTALAERVAGATVLDDDGTEAEVSASGRLFADDLVVLGTELVKQGDALRVVTGGGKLLAAETLGYGRESGISPIVLVFTQNGGTFIKLAKFEGGTWTLGATVPVLADVALEKAALIPFSYGFNADGGTHSMAALCYADGSGDGVIQFWGLYSDLTAEFKGTDVFAQDAPVNICGTWSPKMEHRVDERGMGNSYFSNSLTIVHTNGDGNMVATLLLPSSRWVEETQKVVYYIYKKEPRTILPGPMEGPACTSGTMDDFTVPEIDTQDYQSRAWDVAAKLGSGAVFVSFPGADGKRYLLTLWTWKSDNAKDNIHFDFANVPVACSAMVQEDYLPCVSLQTGVMDDLSYDGVRFVGGISRANRNGQRSSLGLEFWSGGAEIQSWPMRFSEDDSIYDSNVGLVSTCRIGEKKDRMAIGYCAENVYRAFVCRRSKGGVCGFSAVELGGVGTSAELVESGAGAALAYELGGDVFLQQLSEHLAAERTEDGRVAEAIAITDAGAGKTVKLRLLK